MISLNKLTRVLIVAKYIFLFLLSFILFFSISQSGYLYSDKNNGSNLPATKERKANWDEMGSIVSAMSYTLSFVVVVFTFVSTIIGFFLKKFLSDFKILEKEMINNNEKINNRVDKKHSDTDGEIEQLKEKINNNDHEIRKKINNKKIEIDKKLEKFSYKDKEITTKFDNFEGADKKVRFKRKAIEKTLIRCLEAAGEDQTKAFSTYIKLIAIYDVLFPSDYIGEEDYILESKKLEGMQMAATTIYNEQKSVPLFIIDKLLEEEKIPTSIKRIIMTGKSY